MNIAIKINITIIMITIIKLKIISLLDFFI